MLMKPLLNNDKYKKSENDGRQQIPHPHRNFATVERSLHIGINVIKYAIGFQFIQCHIYGFNKFLVMTDITVFSRCQSQVNCCQIIQMLAIDDVTSLIPKAYHSIILASRQFFHRFRQIGYDNRLGSRSRQSIKNRTRTH